MRDRVRQLGLGELEDMRRLTGGASRETWLLELRGGRNLILRRDPVGGDMSADLLDEAAAMRAARAAGVPVPEVLGDGDDLDGAPWVLCDWVEGETLPARILRDDAFAQARAVLGEQCGRALAGVHAMDAAALPHLTEPDPLAALRTQLDGFEEDSAIFELAFRRLEATRPRPVPPRVVHGDFRMGNLMVGPDGIRAVLDWELCHLGDPAEDLGYLCMRAWRFGGRGRVGGFGTLEELLAGHGGGVEPERVRWWELRATLWWGINCMEMARPHLDGELRSVERATIGRRVREQEYDLMGLLA